VTVHVGFEIGTGARVEIPLAHTFVSGQTQLSGKTTALRAIVERSGRRALAFVTKRGENLEGRQIRPYLPREGEAPIGWRTVEVILASAVEQRNLRFERLQIINAAKAAMSLDDVQRNVQRYLAAKGSEKSKEVYTLLNEYLELVLPQMRALNASHTLDLQPGLNVMDLSGLAVQTQGMVIRAAFERINHHETQVLTVLPEAWEFAPRDRAAPARREAEDMARKGAAPKVSNLLLCDSQDIAGVSPVIRQASSVWLLGVQRELNELKRAVTMMPVGVQRPKADEVATLGLGQFYVCYGSRAIKTYAQPAWMSEALARDVAIGKLDVRNANAIASGANVMRAARSFLGESKEEQVTKAEAEDLRRKLAALEDENRRWRETHEGITRENDELRRRVAALEKGEADDGRRSPAAAESDRGSHAPAGARRDRPSDAARGGAARAAGAGVLATDNGHVDEGLYQAIKARLEQDAPGILKLLTVQPELVVEVERREITADASSTQGRVGRLLKSGFLGEAKRFNEILREMERTGPRVNNKSLSVALQELVRLGFVTNEGVQRYRGVPEMHVRVVER
jgi:hypothetical protein